MLPLGVVALAITHTVSELDGAGRRVMFVVCCVGV